MTIEERARQILADYRKHADQIAVCDSYYCGQECSYLNEIDERVGALLEELAGVTSDRSA